MSVKFDRTYIVVRQRNILETFDLSLQIVRDHAVKLFFALLIGILPWFIIDFLILYRWMAAEQYGWGYLIAGILVALQAPLGTAVITDFLGSVMFMRKASVTRSTRSVIRNYGKLIILHGFIRLAIPWTYLVALASPGWGVENFGPYIMLLLPIGLAVSLLIRGLRPFSTEVVLLEKPKWKNDAAAMTFSGRNSSLHRHQGAELLGKALVTYFFGIMLAISIGFMFEARMYITGSSSTGYSSLTIFVPLACWMAAGYTTVARFLSYIDLRIRQEGWEVELKLRAEATKYLERSHT